MSKAISKEQIKRIYALGSAIGILESGNKDDDLHALVYSIAGKESVKALSEGEFKKVEKALMDKMKIYRDNKAPKPREKSKDETVAGMMTKAQQTKAWKLIYELIALDPRGGSATAGERMVGAIRKILNIQADVKKPFAWISFEQGSFLIEQLKRYVASAESKSKRVGGASCMGT